MECGNQAGGADGGDWNHGAYSFEDDKMSLPLISMGDDQFPGCTIQDDGYSYTPNLNCSPGPVVDNNWINIKSDLSESRTDYEMLPPQMSIRGDGADFLKSPSIISMDYGNSEIPTNCAPPKCETGTGYPIKIHGAEAQNSRISSFQMGGQFSSLGCTSLLPPVDNFGARGHINDINIVPLSSSSPQKVDQNYLTLGIDGGTKFRRNSNFSTREVSNKLQEFSSQCNNPLIGSYPKNTVSLTQVAGGDARSQSHAGGSSRLYSNFSTRKIPSRWQEVSFKSNNSSIGDCPENPLILDHDPMLCGDSRIQTNAGGCSISNSDVSAQEITNKLDGISFRGNSSVVGHYPRIPLNSSQWVGGAGELPRSASNLASRVPTCAEGGLVEGTGFRQNSIPFPGLHTRQTNIPSNTPSKCYTSVSQQIPNSLPSGSNLFSQTNCGSQTEVTSAYFDTPPISWQQDYSRKSSMIASSESSRNYLYHRHKQSSTGHVQPGYLRSTAEVMRTEGDLIGNFPPSVQPVGQFDAFHNPRPNEAPRNFVSPGVQLSKSSINQSDAAGYFPKRLGLPANDFAIARHIRGQYQHGMSTQSSAVFPRVDNSSGQVVPDDKLNIRPQVAPNISLPPLKRKAVADPSALPVQRRKVLPQPVINDSTPHQRLRIPTIPAATHIPPAAPLHIKWKGFEETLEPLGKRCLLCKRDLSFTAEGLMYQPTAPPPVAVLPCGHTFHDHCLQIITPRDQLENPPCIPCAVGET